MGASAGQDGTREGPLRERVTAQGPFREGPEERMGSREGFFQMLEWKGQSEGCWGEKEGEGDWRRRQERQSSRKRKQAWKWRGSPRCPPSQPLPDPDTCWPDALARGIGMTGQPDSSVGLHIPLQSITEADHRGRLENGTTG